MIRLLWNVFYNVGRGLLMVSMFLLLMGVLVSGFSLLGWCIGSLFHLTNTTQGLLIVVGGIVGAGGAAGAFVGWETKY